MADRRPVTQDDYDQVAQLHAQHLSRNEIARRLGRSGKTVSRIAKEVGLTFERGEEVRPPPKPARCTPAPNEPPSPSSYSIRRRTPRRRHAAAAAQLDKIASISHACLSG